MFLTAIEQKLGMRLSTGISRDEIYYRISYASSGIVNNIMSLMFYGKDFADQKSHTNIELDDLIDVFERMIKPDFPYLANPFVYDADDAFVAPIITSTAGVMEQKSDFFRPQLSTR